MRDGPSSNPHWDRIGIFLSVACAFHCAVLPFLLTALPVAGLAFGPDSRVEWALIYVTFGFGSGRVFYSYFETHRRVTPSLLFLAGAAAILMAKSLLVHFAPRIPLIETAGMVSGGLLIAIAHFVNDRLTHRGERAEVARRIATGTPDLLRFR